MNSWKKKQKEILKNKVNYRDYENGGDVKNGESTVLSIFS